MVQSGKLNEQEMNLLIGRGLPENFNQANNPVRIQQIFANSQNKFADLWHVDLMGWHIEGMLFKSRQTYSYNIFPSKTKDLENAVSKDLGPIIKVAPEHLSGIWSAIADYILTGNVPSAIENQ